jgi:16S rRNA (cytosine1402-N4)-methyltransferase
MHIPVLQKEVLQYLDPKANENFADCTFGEGGHTLAILEKNGPKGKVLGIELDKEVFKKSAVKKIERLVLVNNSYFNLKEIVEKERFKSIDGILMDLGFSSWHTDESLRGFSFKKNEPLDMRYDQQNPLTAEKILNYYSGAEIEKILREYGEENFSEKISKEIIATRKIREIKSTFQLVEIIKRAVPSWYQGQKIHFATRTFQALRIAVNNELDNLKKTLPKVLETLKSGGRLVVISFHSLEDRIVKNFIKDKFKEKLVKILTKKPVGPTNEEILINPRSRSAKLRAIIKI